MKQSSLILFFFLVLLPLCAENFYSVSSGSWFDSATWNQSGNIPGANDNVYIGSGHSVELVGASSVYVNSLVITGLDLPSALVGPYNMDCVIYITENLDMLSSPGSASLIPGDYGTLRVELGHDLLLDGQCLYQAQRTTFTALEDPITRRAQLNVIGSPQINTIFDTSETAVMIEVSSSITFPEGFAYGFENARIDLWDTIGLSNCYFNNCYLAPRNNTCINTLNNCHLYGCTTTETMYLSGPVALMDNNNVFNNLNIMNGGSLWGNWGTGSSVMIDNDLTTQNGSLVAAGEYGTLSVYLRGNLSVGGQFFPTELVFIGSRPDTNPQVISRGAGADVQCTVSNSGSTLRLGSDFEFNALLSYFYPGQLFMDNHTLSNAVVCNGQIYNSGTLTNCYLSSTDFWDNVTMQNCVINDNSVVCHGDLNLDGGLAGAYGADTDFSILGNLIVTNGNIVPGDYALFNIHLTGNLDIHQDDGHTIGFAPSKLILESTAAQTLSVVGTTLNCNVQVVGFQPILLESDITFAYSEQYRLVADSNPTTVFMLQTHTIQNATLEGGIYTYGGLGQVKVYGINGIDVVLTGTVVLMDNASSFAGETSNCATLEGTYGADCILHIYGSFNNSNMVAPGSFGTLNVYCHGSLYDRQSDPGTWQGALHLVGTEARNIIMTEPISIMVDDNASFSLTGQNLISSFTIESGSSVTVASEATLSMANLNDWYTGELINNGSLSNSRSIFSEDAVYHGVVFCPGEAYNGSQELYVMHIMAEPANLPSNSGERWVFSHNQYSDTLQGNLVFNYHREMSSGLSLYCSYDYGVHWTLYEGNTFLDPGTHTFTAYNVNIGYTVYYALSTCYSDWTNSIGFTPDNSSATPLLAHFDWPDLYGGTAYLIEISNDDWQSVCYFGDVVSVSEYTLNYALAPSTTYRWKVYATSQYLGDVVSLDTYMFHTRAAMTCSLPSSSAYLPGDPISFYMPAFIHNLVAGETITVTPYSSANLQAVYAENVLTITPATDWTGSENIDLQIADDYSVLNLSLNIIVLGKPANLQISTTEIDEVTFSNLSWDEVPGATYYSIFFADAPEGPWNMCAWTVDEEISLPQVTNLMFYHIKACTGALPR